ncbi:MAG TPA: SWIM zinc finger family protein [Thermomicrobiales bacterium]|nr:SWIM zinc finger family protein [Thermomicrobiales bacterium]
MAQFSRTWWGQRFLDALEQFTDPARLGRGRSYASGGRILDYTVAGGTVTATVRGSINPYFGVYKEPRYRTTITLAPIARKDWAAVVGRIGARADLVTQLLQQEMPDAIEDAFAAAGLHLLPHSRRDFTTDCSCPDYANPCKHVAGVCYVLAAALDRDPFLLFALRGLSREELRAELLGSPLGRILATALAADEPPVTPAASYHTRPTTAPAGAAPGLREFWAGAGRLPEPAPPPRHTVPAVVVKKQGDFPPFWHEDASFIGVMEELYERVRTKNRQLR